MNKKAIQYPEMEPKEDCRQRRYIQGTDRERKQYLGTLRRFNSQDSEGKNMMLVKN